MDAKAFSVYVDKHSNQIESVEFIPPVLGKDNDFGHFVVTEKLRKTIRMTDEHKQLLEKGSQILAKEMEINRAKERQVITRSPEYKKSMSEAFKMVAREMDKLR